MPARQGVCLAVFLATLSPTTTLPIPAYVQPELPTGVQLACLRGYWERPHGERIACLVELQKFAQELGEVVELFIWAEDVVTALRLNEAPPEFPALPWPADELDDILKTRIDGVRALSEPQFSPRVLTVGRLPAGFDAVRVFLRSRVQEAADGVSELQQASEEFRPSLEAVRESAGQSIDVLVQLAELLAKLIESGFDLSRHLTYAWFNNVAVYQKQLAEIRSVADAKLQELNKAVDGRKAVLRPPVIELRSALAVESAALDGQATVLRTKVEELLDRKTKLDEMDREIFFLEARIGTATDEVDELEDEIPKLRARISQLEAARPRLQREIQEYSAKLNRRYDYCPNNEPIEKCGHEELKKKFKAEQDNYTGNRNAARNQLAQVDAQLAEARKELKESQTRLATLQTHLGRLSDERDTLREQYAADRKAYESDHEKTMAELWKSRATTYFTENANDQRLVQTLLEALK